MKGFLVLETGEVFEGAWRENEREREREGKQWILSDVRVRIDIVRETTVHVDVSLIIKRQINPGLSFGIFVHERGREKRRRR